MKKYRKQKRDVDKILVEMGYPQYGGKRKKRTPIYIIVVSVLGFLIYFLI